MTTARAARPARHVTIQVVRPARKQIVFEDVHFDFDRYSLRPEATRALDEAIKTLQENADLRHRDRRPHLQHRHGRIQPRARRAPRQRGPRIPRQPRHRRRTAADRQLRRRASEARQRARRNTAPEPPRRVARQSPVKEGFTGFRVSNHLEPSGHDQPRGTHHAFRKHLPDWLLPPGARGACRLVVRRGAAPHLGDVDSHRPGDRRRVSGSCCRSPPASRKSPASNHQRPGFHETPSPSGDGVSFALAREQEPTARPPTVSIGTACEYSVHTRMAVRVFCRAATTCVCLLTLLGAAAARKKAGVTVTSMQFNGVKGGEAVAAQVGAGDRRELEAAVGGEALLQSRAVRGGPEADRRLLPRPRVSRRARHVVRRKLSPDQSSVAIALNISEGEPVIARACRPSGLRDRCPHDHFQTLERGCRSRPGSRSIGRCCRPPARRRSTS